MSDELIKFNKLKVLAYGLDTHKENESCILPSIKLWDKEFCDILNKIEIKDRYFKLDDQNITLLEGKSCQSQEILEIIKGISSVVQIKDIYIYDKLDVDFVRFTDTIILKEESVEYIKRSIDSIKSGLSFMKQFKTLRNEILKDTNSLVEKRKEEIEKICKNITNICGFSAFAKVDNERYNGKDNNILYELFQNANDRIEENKDGSRCLYIEIDENKLKLRYKEKGFSARDFLAISTSGNSGNIDDVTTTGHKGTGFKSIYNKFNKVKIRSGYIECTLDDTQKLDECNSSFEDNEPRIKCIDNNGEKECFPIPIFEYVNKKSEETEIILSFIDNNSNQEFRENNYLSDIEQFKESKVFYFLDSIDEFYINGDKFDKKEFMKENFWENENGNVQFESYFDLSDEDFQYNPRWKDKKKEFNESGKNKIQLIFPKLLKKEFDLLNETDNSNFYRESQSESNVYCTLPIEKIKLYIKFYINCPAFELVESRNDYISAKEEENTIPKWNSIIEEKVLGSNDNEDNAFTKAFNEFSDKYRPYALLYFPSYYVENNLKKVKFIQANNGEVYSISEIENKELKFLYTGMYRYFDEIKKIAEKDYEDKIRKLEKITPFVLYDSDNISSILAIESILNNKINKNFEEIENFFEENFYLRGSGKNLNEQEKNLLIEVYKEIEQKSMSDDINNIMKKFYKYYLGEELCNKQKIYYINEIDEIVEYTNIQVYKDKLEGVFVSSGSINTLEILKDCFENIITDIYRTKDGKIVSETDIENYEFLNKVLCKTQLYEYIFSCSKLLKEETKEERENLFTNGKIVIKLSSDNYKLSNDIDEVFISSVIKNSDLIISNESPEWIKNKFKVEKNLDKLLCTSDFYIGIQNLDNYFEIINEYLKYPSYIEEITKSIYEYIKNNNDDKSKKNLFEIICLNSKGKEIQLDWESNFIEYLDIYNNNLDISTDSLKFSSPIIFNFKNELSSISQGVKDRFENRVEAKEQEKKISFFDEEKTFREIVNNYVKISIDKKGNSRKYCIGKFNGEKIIIVFGEDSVGKMLSKLFNCNDYVNPKVYLDMESKLPSPLLNNEYDDWIEEDFNNYKDLLEDNRIEDKKLLKLDLINSYEVKVKDVWKCFKGYGGRDNYKEKKCTLCDGILISESSNLSIRYVQGIKGIHLPILVCHNCSNSMLYSENVYFVDDKDKVFTDESKEKLIEQLKSTKEIPIMFDMYTKENKKFHINMTFLHRLICLKFLEN